jgi:CRISPR type III-B/RAMP module-associated protein Cmr5
MQSLEQIRAAGALKAAGAKDRNGKPLFTGKDVAGIPALILSNGLLSTLAFAGEQKREGSGNNVHLKAARPEMKAVFDSVARHLSQSVAIHGITLLTKVEESNLLLSKLAGEDANSLDVQRATAEALAFLSYLKRFAEPAE